MDVSDVDDHDTDAGADADAATNAVASAFGSSTVANISVMRFIVPCMPLTATAVVSFSFCVRVSGATTLLAFDPLERFFRGDVGGRGSEMEGSGDGPADCILVG